MKIPRTVLLLSITALLAVFTVGFFLGRKQHGGGVQLSVPDTMLTAPTAPAGTQEIAESAAPAYPVNINTAGLQEFMTLPDIGMVLAQRIIDYRDSHGEFRAVEELMNVEGIGEKRMQQLLDLVTIGG